MCVCGLYNTNKCVSICVGFLKDFLCVSEVKLSLASFLSDRIVDEILEALSTSQHTLVRSQSSGLSDGLSIHNVCSFELAKLSVTYFLLQLPSLNCVRLLIHHSFNVFM